MVAATADPKKPSTTRSAIRMAHIIVNLSYPPLLCWSIRPYRDAMPTTTSTPTLSFVAKLVAKDDTAGEVVDLLTGAVELANAEAGTVVWFALRTDANTFWIVDAFGS